MEQKNLKLDVMTFALERLHDGIELFNDRKQIFENSRKQKDKDFYLMMRDAMLKRFSYNTDLFWKVVKLYLEKVEQVEDVTPSPCGIISAATKACFLSEDEAATAMKMANCRNKVAHAYKQDVAQEIAHEIPQFYEFLDMIVARIKNKL